MKKKKRVENVFPPKHEYWRQNKIALKWFASIMTEGKSGFQSMWGCPFHLPDYGNFFSQPRITLSAFVHFFILKHPHFRKATFIGFSRKFQRKYATQALLFFLPPPLKIVFHSIPEHARLPNNSAAVICSTILFLKIWFLVKASQYVTE